MFFHDNKVKEIELAPFLVKYPYPEKFRAICLKYLFLPPIAQES
jgi:hypothetical protein